MFLKNKNIIFKIRRSKVTEYAALKRSEFRISYYHNLFLSLKIVLILANSVYPDEMLILLKGLQYKMVTLPFSQYLQGQ